MDETWTSLLKAVRAEEPGAIDRLVVLTYAELRQLAHLRLRGNQPLTALDTTSLVHECYLKLVNVGSLQAVDRAHFLGYAARAMRSIMVDFARQRAAERRGGSNRPVTLQTDGDYTGDRDAEVLLRVNEALDALGHLEPRLVQVVELKFFAGLTFEEIATALNVNERTARRDWDKARLLLHRELEP